MSPRNYYIISIELFKFSFLIWQRSYAEFVSQPTLEVSSIDLIKVTVI